MCLEGEWRQGECPLLSNGYKNGIPFWAIQISQVSRIHLDWLFQWTRSIGSHHRLLRPRIHQEIME